MSSPSPVPSAPGSQTICSEVTNQTFVNIITDIQAQLTSLSRQQDDLVKFFTRPGTRIEPTISSPLTTVQPFPKPPSYIIPKETEYVTTNSILPIGQGVVPQTSTRTRPTPDRRRRIRRHNAIHHISNAEESAWTAPGGYHPYRDGGHPTPNRTAPNWPPHHPLRFSESQGARGLPPPAAAATLRTQPAQIMPTCPLRRGPYYCMALVERTPPVASGSEISQPPPYPPKTAPTTSAPSPPSPKREGEGERDATDDGGSDKKYDCYASTDGVD